MSQSRLTDPDSRIALIAIVSIAMFVIAGLAISARANPPDPAALVDVAKAIPGIRLDVRYATPDNFTHHAVYPAARCFLRRATAQKLARVQSALAPRGLALKLYDCYRPLAVQRALWRLVPDERYVADPAKGSRHNRGAAVDLTLVDARTGAELPMPTPYDDFTERAHRDYTRLPEAAIANRRLLERAMAGQGFVGLPTEWWHFDDGEWARYPVLDRSFAELDGGRRDQSERR